MPGLWDILLPFFILMRRTWKGAREQEGMTSLLLLFSSLSWPFIRILTDILAWREEDRRREEGLLLGNAEGSLISSWEDARQTGLLGEG